MGTLIPKMREEDLKSLGRVVANFALLEVLVSGFISRLVGQEPELGRIIVSGLPFKQKVTLLSSLYRYRLGGTEELAELERLLDRLSLAEEKRNSIIHSLWAEGQEKDTIRRFKIAAKRSRGLIVYDEELNTQELDEAVNFIASVTYDVQALDERIRQLLLKE